MSRGRRRSRPPSGWRASIKRVVWLATLLFLIGAPSVVARLGAVKVVPAAAVASNGGSTVYFPAGITQIRPRDKSILDAHASWLRDERKRVLVIEGHTDGVGESEFSLEIGEQRAMSAKAYLVTKGAIAARISTESRGGGQPTCKKKTATCRALNRRATVSRGVLP